MLFNVPPSPTKGKDEAVQVDGLNSLKKIKSAYRIKEQSAVPLALPGQIALGGASLGGEDFDSHMESYVALHLDDGTSIFKRVGPRLPAPFNHLRQFETIGGLGMADVLAVGKPEAGFKLVKDAVLIIGVLYHA